MSPLEIRLIAYAIAAIVLLGGSGFIGYRVTANHYEALIAHDRQAQDKALQDAQQSVIAAQQAQQSAIQKAEKDHEALVSADTQSRTAILGSVRNLETALRLGSMPPAVADSSKPGGAPSESNSDSELTESIRQFNDAVAKAISSCQHDSTELASILELEPK